MRKIIDEFRRDLDTVYSLLDFDLFIIELPLSEIKGLKDYAEQHKLPIVRQRADKLEKLLTGIKSHGSTKLSYDTIYNQCIVLTVSYFSATLENLFEYCIESALEFNRPDSLLSKEIKIRVRDICSIGENPKAHVGEFLVSSNNISFQDMQSISRTFKEYLKVDIEKDELTNDIIIAQAARHIIVHNGSEINSKFINQIALAAPRTVKPEVPQVGRLSFSKEEVSQVGKKMEEYMLRLIGQLEQYQRN
jgi:hypothetical protein